MKTGAEIDSIGIKEILIVTTVIIWLLGIPIAEVFLFDIATGWGEHGRATGADASGELAYALVLGIGIAIQWNLLKLAVWIHEKFK